MSKLHVFEMKTCISTLRNAACQSFMSMLHALASCPCFMSLLHVLAVCPCCVSLLHVLGECPWCMSMLHVHAACMLAKLSGSWRKCLQKFAGMLAEVLAKFNGS
jgi:hypothetical protein